jgi:hypothetical protein
MENDPAAQYSYPDQKPDLMEEIEDELSWDDIQRLTCAFIICILGTAAHKGSIFWTILFFCAIIFCGIWWISDKTDDFYKSMTKKKTMSQKYSFRDEL